ncbi:hypothetical protein EV128_12572 [Rhizobium azibense]|nr:hypothetical protein EV128_12572 [Rhizobium azibense]
MQNTFTIITATYDVNSDTLTATVEHKSDRKHEIYSINAEFSYNRYAIRDETKLITQQCDYAPAVLAAFMRSFKRAYYALDASASPADAFDELTEFTVEFDA